MLNNQIKLSSLILFIGFIIILKKISISLFKYFYKFSARLISTILLLSAFIFIINLTLYYDKNTKNNELIIQNKWQNFNLELIEKEILNNNIVFVQVTADWCATCKINQLLRFCRIC